MIFIVGENSRKISQPEKNLDQEEERRVVEIMSFLNNE
jgi:hypothetical protein